MISSGQPGFHLVSGMFSETEVLGAGGILLVPDRFSSGFRVVSEWFLGGFCGCHRLPLSC